MSVRSERIKAGVSPNEVCAALGVSRVSLYKWEVGDALPSVKHLVALSALFGCSVDALLSSDEDE